MMQQKSLNELAIFNNNPVIVALLKNVEGTDRAKVISVNHLRYMLKKGYMQDISIGYCSSTWIKTAA